MSQDRIDLDALFDLQEQPKAPPARPQKKPGLIILVSILALAVLAAGAYLFWRFTDTSNPIRITVYKQPLVEDNFTEVDLTHLGDRAVFDITDGYQRFFVEPDSVQELTLGFANFWLLVRPNSWAVRENWSISAQAENICSAAIHESQLQPSIGYYKLLDEEFDFDGWVIYGYLPRSADLRIQLSNGSGKEVSSQAVHIDPYISLVYEPYYYTKVTEYTLELLDYAVHLKELAPLMELPTEELLSAYIALAEDHPALLILLHQTDFHLAIEAYESTGDPVCKTYAEKLDPLFAAYREHPEYDTNRGSFISTEEAAAMDTQALVEYLAFHTDLRDYIMLHSHGHQWLDKTDLFLYLAHNFCAPLLELEKREDAASALLPLVPESLVAEYLITLPQIQRYLKLDEIETYLLAVHRGGIVGLDANVVDLLCAMDDMSTLPFPERWKKLYRTYPCSTVKLSSPIYALYSCSSPV